MSISDYLKYKRVTVSMKELNKYSPVLSNTNYTDFKEFAIEKQTAYINNTKGYASPVNNNGTIFGMSLKTTNCSTFPLCKQTNLRANRVPISEAYSIPKYVTPYRTKIVTPYGKTNPVKKIGFNCDPDTRNTIDSYNTNTGDSCISNINGGYSNSNHRSKLQVYAMLQ
jgi:hypothetical protein